MSDRRTNRRMRAVVGYARALAWTSIREAARYLAEQKIPFDIAHRVLTQRDQTTPRGVA